MSLREWGVSEQIPSLLGKSQKTEIRTLQGSYLETLTHSSHGWRYVFQGQEGKGQAVREHEQHAIIFPLLSPPCKHGKKHTWQWETVLSKSRQALISLTRCYFPPAVGPWTQNVKKLHYWKPSATTSDLHQGSPLPLLHLPSWALRPALL